MSISEKITRLQAAKEDIAEAIVTNGGTVNEGDGFEEFSSDINTIGAAVEDVSRLIERSLISYDVPEGITTIGQHAFDGMYYLQTVTIPTSVRSISFYAFSGCKALKRIILPDSVVDIGVSAFSQCYGLIVAGVGSAGIIGFSAFIHCKSLKKIIISKATTEIRDSAFFNCTSLTDVYYRGNETEWAAITIGNGNTNLTSATIHYNYTGDGSEL